MGEESNLKENTAEGSFYETNRLVLLFGRYAGVLPLEGLSKKISKNTRLILWSPYSIVYIPSFLALVSSYTLITIYSLIGLHKKITVAKLIKTIFYPTILITFCFLFRICFKWKKSLNDIEAIEKRIPKHKIDSTRKLNNLLKFLLVFNQVEHAFYMVHKINEAVCDGTSESFEESLKTYLLATRPWLFNYTTPLGYGISLLYEISSVQYAFLWAYMDMVAISFTFYLVQKFKQFNEIFFNNVNSLKHPIGSLWVDTKEYYTRLIYLNDIVDDLISPLVFLSFANNLQKVCVKLLYVIQAVSSITTTTFNATCPTATETDWEHITYVTVTVLFLFTKTLTLTIIGAHLNDISRKPLEALHTMSADFYNKDFQIFIDEVYHAKIEINGFKTFYMNQSSVLQIIAAIFTYELIMIQNNIFSKINH